MVQSRQTEQVHTSEPSTRRAEPFSWTAIARGSGSVYGGEYGGRQGLTFLARGSRRALAGFDASLGRNENTVVVCVGLGTWSPGS